MPQQIKAQVLGPNAQHCQDTSLLLNLEGQCILRGRKSLGKSVQGALLHRLQLRSFQAKKYQCKNRNVCERFNEFRAKIKEKYDAHRKSEDTFRRRKNEEKTLAQSQDNQICFAVCLIFKRYCLPLDTKLARFIKGANSQLAI